VWPGHRTYTLMKSETLGEQRAENDAREDKRRRASFILAPVMDGFLHQIGPPSICLDSTDTFNEEFERLL
jgi:hypothetical protein